MQTLYANNQQNQNNMKQQKMIDELMYRIDRYRSMGNGAMAQTLSKQLRELNAQVK